MSALFRQLILGSLLSGLSIVASPALAQDGEAPPPPPIPETDTPTTAANRGQPEPLPPKVQDEQLEPTVTIRKEGNKTYEEYRYDGRIYMIKVTPAGGPPYYLFDTDGDGDLETHSDDQRGQPVKPVYWKLKEWK
ncbi:MAG: hypothetical protein Tsb002_25850 [Wenzhouxiangellaceae bacterium]